MNLQDVWKDLSPEQREEALRQLNLKKLPKSKEKCPPPSNEIPADALVWKCGWTWNFQGAQVGCHCGKCKEDADPVRR